MRYMLLRNDGFIASSFYFYFFILSRVSIGIFLKKYFKNCVFVVYTWTCGSQSLEAAEHLDLGSCFCSAVVSFDDVFWKNS